jgi:hypothetical protein
VPAQATTEEYNGSSWTAGGNLATAKHSTGGAGIQTAALCFGGRVPPIGSTNVTEIYDGTSWTPGSNMNTARRYLSGTGTQTSALGFGGIWSSRIFNSYRII